MNVAFVGNSRCNNDPRPVGWLMWNDKQCKVLLDIGAEVSLIAANMVVGKKRRVVKRIGLIPFNNGKSSEVNEVAEVSIRGLDGTIMTFIAYVLEDLESQFIIGADQLSQLIEKSLKTPIGEFFVTKRILLRMLGSIFDPLGWVDPITLILKSFLQIQKKSMDEELEEPCYETFKKFWTTLPLLRNLNFDRNCSGTKTPYRRKFLCQKYH